MNRQKEGSPDKLILHLTICHVTHVLRLILGSLNKKSLQYSNCEMLEQSYMLKKCMHSQYIASIKY